MMLNIEKYNQVFIECFDINEQTLTNELVYNGIDAWDSIGHMAMVAALEDVFDIMLDTDDVIDFNSYEKGKEILLKYEVVL